jgi:hypothetical protein
VFDKTGVLDDVRLHASLGEEPQGVDPVMCALMEGALPVHGVDQQVGVDNDHVSTALVHLAHDLLIFELGGDPSRLREIESLTQLTEIEARRGAT